VVTVGPAEIWFPNKAFNPAFTGDQEYESAPLAVNNCELPGQTIADVGKELI